MASWQETYKKLKKKKELEDAMISTPKTMEYRPRGGNTAVGRDSNNLLQLPNRVDNNVTNILLGGNNYVQPTVDIAPIKPVEPTVKATDDKKEKKAPELNQLRERKKELESQLNKEAGKRKEKVEWWDEDNSFLENSKNVLYKAFVEKDDNRYTNTKKYKKLNKELSEVNKQISDTVVANKKYEKGFAGGIDKASDTFLGNIETARRGTETTISKILGQEPEERSLTETTAEKLSQKARQETKGIGGVGLDVLGSVSRMLPQLAMGNPTGAMAMGFANYGGGAYNQARQEGATDKQATMYGATIGGLEMLLNKILPSFDVGGSNIYGKTLTDNVMGKVLSNTAFRQIASGMAGEFTEEYLQEFLEPIVKNVVLEQDNGADFWKTMKDDFGKGVKQLGSQLFNKENLYAGTLGAITSGAMGAPSAVDTYRYEKAMKNKNSNQETIAPIVQEKVIETEKNKNIVKNAMNDMENAQNNENIVQNEEKNVRNAQDIVERKQAKIEDKEFIERKKEEIRDIAPIKQPTTQEVQTNSVVEAPSNTISTENNKINEEIVKKSQKQEKKVEKPSLLNEQQNKNVIEKDKTYISKANNQEVEFKVLDVAKDKALIEIEKSTLPAQSKGSKVNVGLNSPLVKGIVNNNAQNSADNAENTAENKNKPKQQVMTEEEYLSSKGYGGFASDTMYDIVTTPTTMNESNRSGSKREKLLESKQEEYYTKKEELRKEYQEKLKSGEIRKPTRIEESLKTAQGLDDNEAVQASRRILTKLGIDWKTGEKLTDTQGVTQNTTPTQEELDNLENTRLNESGSKYASAFFDLKNKYGEANLYKGLNKYKSTGKAIEDIAPIKAELTDLTSDLKNTIKDTKKELKVLTKEINDVKASVNDIAPIKGVTEEDTSLYNQENFDNLEKQGISPVQEVIPYSEETKVYETEKEVKEVIKKRINGTPKQINDVYKSIVGIEDFDIQDVKNAIDDYSKYVIKDEDLDLKQLKKHIRETKLNISNLKANDSNFKDYVSQAFGSMRLANTGQAVDSFYQEMSEEYPALLPKDVINEADQFQKLLEVSKQNTISSYEDAIPDEVMDEYANEIYGAIKNYQGYQASLNATKDFAKAVKRGDIAPIEEDIAPIVEKPKEKYEAIAPMKSEETKMIRVKPELDIAPIKQEKFKLDEIPKDPTKESTYDDLIDTEEMSVKKSKKEIRRELLGNTDELVNALDNAKNLSTFMLNNTDPIRINEMVFGRKLGNKINDLTVQKVKDNESDRIRFLNEERNQIKELGIKARSKESTAVQKYAEKRYVNEYGEYVEYGDKELALEFPDIKTQDKIKNASKELRKKYDDYIDKTNDMLGKLGFEPIKKRNNYMRHFQELTDVFSKNGLPFNPNDQRQHDLPTDINGLTDTWSPSKNYFANMQERKGLKTTYDAITGIDGYLDGISKLMYHTEDIQRGRAFEELIRETYGEQKGWENLENLPEEQRADREKLLADNHMSSYVAYLHEYTNNLAGKKAKADRAMESIVGRRAFNVVDTIRKQVGANMVGGNIGSALTNGISIMQSLAKTNKLYALKGTADTIKNVFVKDNFADKNNFLTSRFDSDSISKTKWQKLQDAGYLFMKGTDWFSSNAIVRSKYYELRAKGMSEEQAHIESGKFASKIMGDRSLGASPIIYNSKALGLITQFQMEVNNQLYSTFYDTYQDSKENAKGNAIKTTAGTIFVMGQMFALTHVFGKVFESVAGYNPTFDVIEIIKTALGFGDDDEEEKTTSERLSDAFNQTMKAMPYVSIIFNGGRIPISEALPLGQLATGKDKNGNDKSRVETLKETIPYYLMPFGYGQYKKTSKGLGMYDEDLPIAGSYTDSGNLRFTAEDDLPSKIKAGVFGQWSSEEAQDYINSEFKSVKKEDIDELKELGMTSTEYRKYKDGLNKAKKKAKDNDDLTTSQATFDYIKGLDVTEEQKSIMLETQMNNNQSDEDKEAFNKLNMTTSEKYSYYGAKSNIGSFENEYNNTLKKYKQEYGEYSSEYKDAVKELSKDKQENIINTILDSDLSDETKSYLYGKYYSSEKTLNKITESGTSIDTYLTFTKDTLRFESDVDEDGDVVFDSLNNKYEEYLLNSDLSDEDKTTLYERAVLSGFDNEDKYKDYKTIKSAGVDINSWLNFDSQVFTSDKYRNGKTIPNSKKNKVISYVNSLNLSIPQKAMMIRTKYSSFDDYNNSIVKHVDSLDLSFDEKLNMLKNIGMKVSSDGTIRW